MVDLDPLFYPKNAVAIIGVSDTPIKGATAFLYAFKEVNFPNPVYCISRKKKIMYDEKAYSSILDVPDEVDYAIIGVPAKMVPHAINECSQKKVKFVTVFTSGFSELGTQEGKALEKELLQNAKGLRIIGPNCLGVFCRESKITLTEILEISDQEGTTAFISQSGGHTGTLFDLAEKRGFPFNKVVSIGNQCDLTFQDFIDYFAKDEKIKVICCYLEQIKDPKNFFNILYETSKVKPVTFLKGGQTQEGLLAAASHTGALSSPYTTFQSAINQHGGLLVESMDELADLTLGSLFLAHKKMGNRIGLLIPGGGSCVEITDQAVKNGLRVPELTSETREKIQHHIQSINTSTRNPVDTGVLGMLPIVYGQILSYIAEDPNIDIIAFYFMTERVPHFAARLYDPNLVKSFLRKIKKGIKKSDKPFICIVPNYIVTDPERTKIRKEFIEGLTELNIPHFPSMQRAANVITKLIKYQKFLNYRKKN